jgi:hypothetical protein
MENDNKPITYRELKNRLGELTEEQLNMSATISTLEPNDPNTEFIPIIDTNMMDADEDNPFDEDHPVLVLAY